MSKQTTCEKNRRAAIRRALKVERFLRVPYPSLSTEAAYMVERLAKLLIAEPHFNIHGWKRNQPFIDGLRALVNATCLTIDLGGHTAITAFYITMDRELRRLVALSRG